MKFFSYEDEILNARDLIWIKKIHDNVIEIYFERDVCWYIYSKNSNYILNNIIGFLNKLDVVVYDIDKKLKSLKKEELEEKELDEKEEFSHFAPV